MNVIGIRLMRLQGALFY